MAQKITTKRRADGAVVVTIVGGGPTQTMVIPAKEWPRYRDEFKLPEPKEATSGD